MTNEDIESLIDSLNRNEFSDHIFRSRISDQVDYAKVWTEEPKGNMTNEGSYSFYFIKNSEGTYVAAVADMCSDLHVFVKDEYRKKGHLCSAMNEVILPHISLTGRVKQVITFEDPSIGKSCVKNWKFSLTSKTSAEKSLACYQGTELMNPEGYKISYADFVTISTRIKKARLYITMVKEQLNASLIRTEDSDIEYLEQELFDLDDRVLSLIEDTQGDLT